MKLTDKQIQAILDEARPSIVEGIKAELRESITDTITHEATGQVAQFVRKWVIETVIPEVEAALIESKDGLISTGVSMAEGIVSALAESSVTELKKKLELSWERKKIFEALFV